MSTAFEVGVLIIGALVASGLYRVAHAIAVHAQANIDIHNREVRERFAVREEVRRKGRE